MTTKNSRGYQECLLTVKALVNKCGWRYKRWLTLSLASLQKQERFYKSELERLEREEVNKEN